MTRGYKGGQGVKRRYRGLQRIRFMKPMFLLFRKACLLYKTWKIVFSRFIFTISDMRIKGVTRGYRELQGITTGSRGLQGVTKGTGGYKGLQGVTGRDKALQGVTKDDRTFFLSRTFPDTFSWSILRKNQG